MTIQIQASSKQARKFESNPTFLFISCQKTGDWGKKEKHKIKDYQ